jgi:rhodanese-related sulfurtransferase
MPETLELTPQEASRLVKGEEAVLIDVREPEEYAIARIDGARLMPMQTIPEELQTLKELAGESKLAILCHHGVRSLQVASWLRGQGLENCYSVAGGIDRWSQEIDPTVPRY